MSQGKNFILYLSKAVKNNSLCPFFIFVLGSHSLQCVLNTHDAPIFLWLAADFSGLHSLVVCLLRHQLRGVISVPFLGHWLCDALSHWEHRVSPVQEKPSTSPIKAPSTSYTHPPAIRSGAVISHSDACPHTLYPECQKMLKRDKERLFVDCRREKKGESILKYLRAKESRWNKEVLFCFIFDVRKLQSYTALPFKSQRCHS